MPPPNNNNAVPVEKGIATSIKELLQSEEIQKNIAQQLYQMNLDRVRRPESVSRVSNFSYYREQFALEIKMVMDEMIQDKRDREWKYSDYPDLKPSSVYQRIYQGSRFLFAHLDPQGYYKEYRKMMLIHRTKSGVRLDWIRDKLEGRVFKPSIVTDAEKTFEWKDQVETFLQDRSKKILHLKHLALTTEQIEDLQLSFEGIDGIMAVVSEKEIKIVKDNTLVDENENENRK